LARTHPDSCGDEHYDNASPEETLGLFDKFRSVSATNRAYSLQEAASGVILGVVASDGHISDDEVSLLNFVANRHVIFRDQPASEYNTMIDRMLAILKRDGWRRMIEKCAADLPRELKTTVFALAVDFVLIDGNVEEEEKEFIENLRHSLEIGGSDAEAIVSVLAMKNGA
jgi:tellurite resistance protein